MYLVGQGKNGPAQHLSSSSQDTAHHMSGITEEVERHDGKVQQTSTSGSAMREIHDSSSSWTDRSLLPRAKAAAKQQPAATRTHTAGVQTSQTGQLQPICQSSSVPEVAVDMPESVVAHVCQAATAVPDAEVAENGMSFVSVLILIMSCIPFLHTRWPM